MSIETIAGLIQDIENLEAKEVRDFIEQSTTQLVGVLGEKPFEQLSQANGGIKKALIQSLNTALSHEIYNEIIQPQQEDQSHAVAKMEIKKVDRLPLNAKLHLLKNNSLLNNIQLAFSDPAHYIEFHDDKFEGMKPSQIQDEITWTIQRYTVIDAEKVRNLLQKLGLPLSYDSIQKTKKILSEAKQHTYTNAISYGKTQEKKTSRILYIQGYPMMFGKNIIHVDYGNQATRAEKSKYDINTSAKLFNDIYSFIRSHDHIQSSEQEGIQQLTLLNELFLDANDILAKNQDREAIIQSIQAIISSIDSKIDATVVKTKIQDLEYIIQNTHIQRNKNKLIAAWNKIKKRIQTQHSIKQTVELQQQALHEDLIEQEYNAKKYIQELQQHINKAKLGTIKNISPRNIALAYEEKLYAKPFYDLRHHTLILHDFAREKKRINNTFIEKLETDLLLQRWYINICNIEHYVKVKKLDKASEFITNTLDNFTYSPDADISSGCIHILHQLDALPSLTRENIAPIIEVAQNHMQESRLLLQDIT